MAERPTADLVARLPWAMRRDMERYLSTVRENGREIFREAEIHYSPDLLDLLLYFDLRRLQFLGPRLQFGLFGAGFLLLSLQ